MTHKKLMMKIGLNGQIVTSQLPSGDFLPDESDLNSLKSIDIATFLTGESRLFAYKQGDSQMIGSELLEGHYFGFYDQATKTGFCFSNKSTVKELQAKFEDHVRSQQTTLDWQLKAPSQGTQHILTVHKLSEQEKQTELEKLTYLDLYRSQGKSGEFVIVDFYDILKAKIDSFGLENAEQLGVAKANVDDETILFYADYMMKPNTSDEKTYQVSYDSYKTPISISQMTIPTQAKFMFMLVQTGADNPKGTPESHAHEQMSMSELFFSETLKTSQKHVAENANDFVEKLNQEGENFGLKATLYGNTINFLGGIFDPKVNLVLIIQPTGEDKAFWTNNPGMTALPEDWQTLNGNTLWRLFSINSEPPLDPIIAYDPIIGG